MTTTYTADGWTGKRFPVYLTTSRTRQTFLRVTNTNGHAPTCMDEIEAARQYATWLVTAAAKVYAKQYGVDWVFSSMSATDELDESRALATTCQREGTYFPVSDANIDDHIFLTDEAEGSYQFWRAMVRNASSVPFGPVGECLLSLLFLDRLLGEVILKESTIYRLMEANFWADHFRVESGRDVRDRLGFAINFLANGPALAVAEEFEYSPSQRIVHTITTH
ncbi:MAG: hypothetical protein ABIR57_05910 [Aeromicrobium sp.]